MVTRPALEISAAPTAATVLVAATYSCAEVHAVRLSDEQHGGAVQAPCRSCSQSRRGEANRASGSGPNRSAHWMVRGRHAELLSVANAAAGARAA